MAPDHDSSPAETSEGLKAEHDVQLSLYRALQEAIRAGRERGEIAGLLEQLAEYTKVHFMSEQLVMRFYDYPGYQAHVQEHDRLMERIESLRRRFDAGDAGPLAELAGSLRGWLLEHMESQDRPWDRFLRGQRRP